jgi:hypothetical protein
MFNLIGGVTEEYGTEENAKNNVSGCFALHATFLIFVHHDKHAPNGLQLNSNRVTSRQFVAVW